MGAAPTDAGPPAAGGPARPVALELSPEVRLDRWLRWQRLLAGDGGAAPAVRRARQERVALAEAGLTSADVEAQEVVVAGVVAERTVERLTASQALARFGSALGALGPQQRARAEAALEAAGARSDGGVVPGLEARFGSRAVQAALARESEVTSAWEALLEGDGP
jgi:hypothetical protein